MSSNIRRRHAIDLAPLKPHGCALAAHAGSVSRHSEWRMEGVQEAVTAATRRVVRAMHMSNWAFPYDIGV